MWVVVSIYRKQCDILITIYDHMGSQYTCHLLCLSFPDQLWASSSMGFHFSVRYTDFRILNHARGHSDKVVTSRVTHTCQVSVCGGVHMCHCALMEVRESFWGVNSFPLPCGSWEWNPGHQTWWQVTYLLSHLVRLKENVLGYWI